MSKPNRIWARIWDADSGEIAANLAGHRDRVTRLAWSPDGGRLATVSEDKSCRLWDRATGEEIAVLRGHSDTVSDVAWSPKGTHLATVSFDGTGRIWDAATGAEAVVLQGHTNLVYRVDWSPDASRLVTASADNTCRIWNAGTGHQAGMLSDHTQPVLQALWNPSGERLATASRSNVVRLWKIDGADASEIALLRGHTGDITDMAWSHHGRLLATVSFDTTGRLWDGNTGEETAVLQGHKHALAAVAWSPDDRRVATASTHKRIRVWDTERGREIVALKGHEESINSVAWSSDGKRLVTASSDKTCRIWDAVSGEEQTTLKFHRGAATIAAWSPNAQYVAVAADDYDGRIVTGYSYKGGTGRSMALANIAWILASNGFRVLAIDWDFEAPGLHRYLHPFIADKELAQSPGLVDFLTDFVTAARRSGADARAAPGDEWWRPNLNLLPYTYSLDWTFPQPGTVDFVPAGQQNAAYGVRVAGFDWQAFYEKLGGGVFLEALKQDLRRRYDFVLIDSRTGISDTAGICTVQMPDDLLVFYTLNQQSMKGAAGVAESAINQRRKSDGKPMLRIWPIPTRIELGEKERLEVARRRSQSLFLPLIGHLTREQRSTYWRDIEVIYQPFFAYEEVLATFAERRNQTASMLSSMEAIARYVSTDPDLILREMPEEDRQWGKAAFLQADAGATSGASGARQVLISYAFEDSEWARWIYDGLRSMMPEIALWFEAENLLPGSDIETELRSAFAGSSVIVLIVGGKRSAWIDRELRSAIAHGKKVVPVLTPRAAPDTLPEELSGIRALHLSPDKLSSDIAKIGRALSHHLTALPDIGAATHSEDPQKNQWGGIPSRNGRTLSAQVVELSDLWHAITLEVQGMKDAPLSGFVEFHLHPSFPKSPVRVEAKEGIATLKLNGWGAFTVGAVADDGRTRLELDLAEDPSFPASFRER